MGRQNTSSPIEPNERRFNRGSWIALAFALFTLIYGLSVGVQAWSIPGDGWLTDGNPFDADPQIHFVLHLDLGPTPLEAGDQILAIDGVDVKTLAKRAYKFYELRAPNLKDGDTLRYTILRGGQTLMLDVAQHFYSPGQLFLAGWKHSPTSSTVSILSSLFFFVVGLSVFFLRPRNRAAHALLFLGVAFLFQIMPSYNFASGILYPTPPPSIPIDGWTFIINPSIMYMALSFPAPKFPMRRGPLLTIAALYLSAPLVFNSAYLLNLDNPPAYRAIANATYVVQILTVFLVIFGSIIHSSLTLKERAARAQLKWVAVGLSSFVVPGVGGWLLGYLLGLSGAFNEAILLLSATGWFLFPVCLAIAITRTRLFDIDVIIRRTLIYGVLSALLLVFYFGAVVVLQQLFRGLTGQGQDLAIILSTLAIAALSAPLRNRVQRAIDHHFYRRKYDAAHVLQSFASTNRDEVDLSRLSDNLMTVVEDAMQPEHVSVWLRRSK